MALVALVTLAAYGLALALLTALPGVDVAQPPAIAWTAGFAVAVAFGAWNVWDSLLDARAAYRRGETARIIAGGLWRLRSDALQGASCTAMAAAGALVIVQWGSLEVRAAIIAVAGLTLAANQVWNRIDRERVLRMPLNVEGERYHAAQAKIRRLEADAALEAAKKHDALAELAPLRGYVQILQRVLRKHGMEIPLEGRFPLEEEPQP
jgi:hypothetical protein